MTTMEEIEAAYSVDLVHTLIVLGLPQFILLRVVTGAAVTDLKLGGTLNLW